MMNKNVILIAAATLALSSTSCQKSEQNDELNFTASIYAGVTESGKKVTWEAGDEITVNGVTYTATLKTDAGKAEFKKKRSSDTDPTGTYSAFYPTGIQKGATSGGTLPDFQIYSADKCAYAPLFATSTLNILSFKNICAILAITVKSADFPMVKSIRVSSSNCAMSGEFSVSKALVAVLNSPADIDNTVTLDCESAVSTDAKGTVFYVSIPAQTYQNLKIELFADGSSYTKTMTSKKDEDVEIEANSVYPVSFVADPAPISFKVSGVPESVGPVAGDFDITVESNYSWTASSSEEGLSVYPSHGNAGTSTVTVSFPAYSGPSSTSRVLPLVFTVENSREQHIERIAVIQRASI